MGYLIGEKFLNFLEVAENDRHWRKPSPPSSPTAKHFQSFCNWSSS